MRYSASVQIKLKVQFACARLSVDPSKKEKAARKAFLQFGCDVALFPLAITCFCLNILSLHDLEIGTVKTNANVQRTPWNWNNSFPSTENLRKKNKHTQGKNYCIFSATFKKVLNLYVWCLFPWHLALITFVASATNDVSKAKRQSRDTTRILSTEEGEGVDVRVRTSSDHSFFWARYEHFIDKVTRRFFFSSIFYFLQSDISFA